MFYYYVYQLLALSFFLYHSSNPTADKQTNLHILHSDKIFS